MKIGLLPLYIALYDDISPQSRPRLEAFYKKIVKAFKEREMEVVETEDFCRLKPEFEKAVKTFEEEQVDVIVTLHMAYSPSLESIEALAGTKLPIVVLDTTETLEFTQNQDQGEVMFNHGIHGVMDMCSMLKRYGKPFAIAAGHYKESDCIDEVCGYVRAAVAASALKDAKVGLVGGAFEGMGDFAVEPEELRERFGIIVESLTPDVLTEYEPKVTKENLERELADNQARFEFHESVVQEDYEKSVTTGLALRACIEDRGYTAFSANFRTVDAMPFIECCKAMERGIGYAGEGDGLTAAFTGALMTAYPETNFVEIFCPDWKNNTVFLSHMAEINYRIADGKPLASPKPGTTNYAGYARMKGGKGVYVNISRGKDDYQLMLCPAEMLSYKTDKFPQRIRGWMRPTGKTTAEFLAAHSKCGATHHSIFVYGATVEELAYFGELLSMDTVVI